MAKEGIKFVVTALAGAILLLLLRMPIFSPVFAALLFILAGYFAFFFRDPVRQVTAAQDEIVSPVDGRILDIDRADGRQRLIVFLSIFDVHIVRLPLAGVLNRLDYFKGQFLPAYREKASELNERVTLEVNHPRSPYTLRLIAGIAARRIKMWVNEGAELQTGQKIGIMMFGSRAEIILPPGIQFQVKKNEKLTGGVTLIATLPKSR